MRGRGASIASAMKSGGYLDGDVAQIAVDSWSSLAEVS